MVAALVFVSATYLEILADRVSNGLVLLTSALLVIQDKIYLRVSSSCRVVFET